MAGHRGRHPRQDTRADPSVGSRSRCPVLADARRCRQDALLRRSLTRSGAPDLQADLLTLGTDRTPMWRCLISRMLRVAPLQAVECGTTPVELVPSRSIARRLASFALGSSCEFSGGLGAGVSVRLLGSRAACS